MMGRRQTSDKELRRLLDQVVHLSPKQFSNRINHDPGLEELKLWIIKSTPKLDNNHSLAERIYWILNGIKDFPRCQNSNCGKPLANPKAFRGQKRGGYSRFCCKKCSNSDPTARAKGKATRYEKNGGKYFSEESNQQRRQSFIDHYGVDNNMKSPEGLKEYQDALERRYGKGIKNQWQRLEVIAGARQFKLGKHGSETWNNPKAAKATKKLKYGDENFTNRPKARETLLRTRGVEHQMKDPEIAAKSFNKSRLGNSVYQLDGLRFDSYPEMCFYIYYRDHGIPLDCHPEDKCLRYQDNKGTWHTYHPDFYLPYLGYLVELKGNNHFKDKDPTKEMISLKGPEYDHVEQAKQRCMKEHGVILITSDDYAFYVKYAEKTYSRPVLMSFRTNKKKMWKTGESIK